MSEKLERQDPLFKAGRLTGVIAAIAVALLMLHVVADTLLRELRGTGLPGTLDYVIQWWMPTIAFGALALAYQQREHIVTTIVYDRLSRSGQKQWSVIATVITTATLGLVAWYGFHGAWDAAESGEVGQTSGFPTWPPMFLLSVAALFFAAETVRGLRAGAEPDESHTPEIDGMSHPREDAAPAGDEEGK